MDTKNYYALCFDLHLQYRNEKIESKKKDRFLYTSRIDEQMAFHKDSGKNIVKLSKWFKIFYFISSCVRHLNPNLFSFFQV